MELFILEYIHLTLFFPFLFDEIRQPSAHPVEYRLVGIEKKKEKNSWQVSLVGLVSSR